MWSLPAAFKKAFLAFAAAVTAFFRHRILWPGSGPDKTFPDTPLPPGSNGCPLMGSNLYAGSSSYGIGVMFTKLFQRMGRPQLFRFYSFGTPMVSVTGKDAIQSVLKTEFRENGVGTLDFSKNFPNMMEVLGNKGVIYENDRDRHLFLRRLVGGAMSSSAVTSSVPALAQAANLQIDRIVNAYAGDKTSVVMHDLCNDFTLDVAWRSILGLNLKGEDEIKKFRTNTKLWLDGILSPLLMMPFKIPFLHRTNTHRGKEYLVSAVESKLQELDRNGPDDSTLSKMYFSTDEDGSTRLSHEELIDNSLILILAGSETSSSTLVNCMLLLGLHKDVLRKLQAEQQALIDKYNTAELTKDWLDNDCPYLDAFIRETLRIRPLNSIELRQNQQTIILDGEQIPKKNYIYANLRATHDQDPSVRENGSDDHMDLVKGFKPERWLKSETTPQEWMPFGMGARRCLGERLAMTEMKVFMASLVRRITDFDLIGVDSAKDVKWKKNSLIPIPEDGVVIRPTALA
jgi:cytochrome P450